MLNLAFAAIPYELHTVSLSVCRAGRVSEL